MVDKYNFIFSIEVQIEKELEVELQFDHSYHGISFYLNHHML